MRCQQQWAIWVRLYQSRLPNISEFFSNNAKTAAFLKSKKAKILRKLQMTPWTGLTESIYSVLRADPARK